MSIPHMRLVSEHIERLRAAARTGDEGCRPTVEDVLDVLDELAEVVRSVVLEMDG